MENLFDVRTLVACNAAFSFYIAGAMLLYKLEHKTYSGYSFWMAGTFCVAMAYLLLIISKASSNWMFIFIHGFIIMAEVLRLDSASRFTTGRRINLLYYALPAGYMVFIFYFSIVYDQVDVRNFMLGIFSALVIGPTCAKFFLNTTAANRILYITAGLLYSLYGIVLLVRSITWLLFPTSGIYASNVAQQGYIFVFMIFEIGLGVTLLMMNSQRLEQDLKASMENLQKIIDELQKTTTEVKTLSGLLPICATCKKIRDDKGYWNQIEGYIKDHSDAKFSHGLCPDCLAKQYPKYAKKVL